MSDENEEGDTGQIAQIAGQFVQSLAASAVRVKLEGGSTVEGALAGFSLRKKEKKGDVTWSGTVIVETAQGKLQIECGGIESIKPK